MKRKLKLFSIYIDGYKNKTSYIYSDDRGNLYTKSKPI